MPEVTIYFWIIKILTTAMGEATSDYMVHRIDPVFAVTLAAVAFGIALALQLFIPRYVTYLYWLALVLVAVFGTMAVAYLSVTRVDATEALLPEPTA